MKIFPLTLIPANTRIDFMRMRHIWVALFVLLSIASVAVVGLKGFNFALDFTGGTAVNVRFEQAVSVDDVRERLETAGIANAQVQTFGSGTDLLIRVRGEEDQTNVDGNAELAASVLSAASTPENPGRILSTESIGSQVSGDLRKNAIYAAIFVLVGFLLYISVRFEWKFAVVASLTTLFDVMVVAALFSLTGREFDLTVLAGLLSVMGFSINDTIVVFDRVRENFRVLRADPLEVFNRSINQTLSRTIITSLVFFLSVLALFLYGGGSLEGLALTQMLGALVGTLSSIFIACPLLTYGALKVTKQDLLPKARDEEALARRP
ncbi:protein translocase subunit SecF [Luteimonas chenhongjianii]|uniref:Protein-export membrane protein SecF n=1 Tax=Luteimonas chenhongjianii TaxID=2006110 RepID=A0A290XDC0_9GAMM|nr:protein translocase subunit SecF [Luteimonas chenhongjianii]ATD67145.1 protein translocase subunit SecF [Luteimonas chenhongjianii]